MELMGGSLSFPNVRTHKTGRCTGHFDWMNGNVLFGNAAIARASLDRMIDRGGVAECDCLSHVIGIFTFKRHTQ